MVRTLNGSVLAAVLALALTTGRGIGQTPLPSAPAPAAPPGSAAPAPPSTPPPGATLGAPSPGWSRPQVITTVPPAPLLPPVPANGPPYPAFEDRNGPLLRGDPLLERPGDQPGLFAEVDIAVVDPHVKNHLQAPVTGLMGMVNTVHAQQAELDWVGVPRLAVGYRFAEGCGEFLVSYRFLTSEGTEVAPNFDFLGDGQVKSRLNMNVIDLDYRSSEYSLAPRWDMRWTVGARIASVYFDSRVMGQFLGMRASNDFFGAGPHAGLELARHFDLPGLAAFGRIDGSVLVGGIDQAFEETFTFPGTAVGNAVNVHGSQAVETLSFELGLRYIPPGERIRFSLGYQFDYWWGLGKAGPSSAELSDQGIFFRSEFNF